MTHFAPVANLAIHKRLASLGLLGDYHLLLAHQVLGDQNGYAAFWRKFVDGTGRSRLDITIDNSVIETGTPMAFGDVIEAANVVGATTVVLPDKIDDKAATLDLSGTAFENFVDDLEEQGIAPLGVAQGRDFDEVLECAAALADMGVQRLAVPRGLTQNEVIGSRVELTKQIWRTHQKPIHLLGFSDNIIDDITASRIPGVIGIDSAVPIWLGLKGKALTEAPPSPQASRWGRRPSDYEEVDRDLPGLVRTNLEAVRMWLSDI